MVRVITTILLLGLAVPLSGCVVAPGGGWCYWHPYRCHRR